MFDQTLDLEHLFGQHDPMPRTSVRRRRVTALVGAGLLLGVVTGPVAHALSGPDPSVIRHYVVRPGDTLWSIALAARPAVDPRIEIDQIQRANALSGSSITPGQRLAVPAA